jgi:hypothetical protein
MPGNRSRKISQLSLFRTTVLAKAFRRTPGEILLFTTFKYQPAMTLARPN